jgi:acetyltransferase-like isoleucine patch superfamily enzyme
VAESSNTVGTWPDGILPPGVRLGDGTLIRGARAFHRFSSKVSDALSIGERCTLDDVQFAVGAEGKIAIGSHSYLSNTILLAELFIQIGSYVIIGFNTTIADSDFHPIDPALRIADAIACSPLAAGRPRPAIDRAAVYIGDNVYIGPSATILKGVHVGDSAFIEPGSVVTRNVPAGSRVLGNPARILGHAR